MATEDKDIADLHVTSGEVASFDLADYDFELPDALIAQTPVEPRHASRLLGLDRQTGAVTHQGVADLPALLPKGALLVVNDTRVVPARLLGRKDSGGKVELLLARPFGADGGGLRGHAALVRSSKSLKPGQKIHVDGRHGGATALVVAVGEGGTATVDLAGADSLADLLERCGRVPLPPYIRGGREEPGLDRARYQCTFAARPGAVAAPTAGLHLSQTLMESLGQAGVEVCRITLHVGPGTFLPVRAADLRGHAVLPERYELTEAAAQQLAAARRDHRPVFAVGTTTTRTLENLALRAGDGPWCAGQGEADLTVLPGHHFRVISGMMTNFHLPRSSLLVLVCAFAGRARVLAAYRDAVARGYRFYSYGDAMLIS